VFGTAVALWDDKLAVGAPWEDSAATGINNTNPGQADNSADASGAVYTFTRSGTTWSPWSYYVKASNTGLLDHFGCSVALWGNVLAVGASGEDSAATGVNNTNPGQGNNTGRESGAVYVFTPLEGSTIGWVQRSYVKSSAAGTTFDADQFGTAVAVWGDTLAVGALGEDSAATGVDNTSPGPADGSASDSGSAYIFQ
jgi:trimeric autotransporter adhesin